MKIWAKLNIRNLVKNYPILQVWSWICGGHGSWFVLISFSLGQVSLLWKFELIWMSGCWEKFVWHSRIESLQVLSTLDFRLWTLDLDLDCDNLSKVLCSASVNQELILTINAEQCWSVEKTWDSCMRVSDHQHNGLWNQDHSLELVEKIYTKLHFCLW